MRLKGDFLMSRVAQRLQGLMSSTFLSDTTLKAGRRIFFGHLKLFLACLSNCSIILIIWLTAVYLVATFATVL